MARKTTSDCCGCETCVNCGRGEYITHICDKCRADDVVYLVDGMELCYECLENKIKSEINNDFSAFISDLFEVLCEYFDIEEVRE